MKVYAKALRQAFARTKIGLSSPFARLASSVPPQLRLRDQRHMLSTIVGRSVEGGKKKIH